MKSLSKRMRSKKNQESYSQHTAIVASGVMTDISEKHYLDIHDVGDSVVEYPIPSYGFSSSQLYLPSVCPDDPFEPEWVDPYTQVPRMMQQHPSNYEVIGCGDWFQSASMVVHSAPNYSMLSKQSIVYSYCVICFVEMVPMCTYSDQISSLTTNHSTDVQLDGYDDPFVPVMVELLPCASPLLLSSTLHPNQKLVVVPFDGLDYGAAKLETGQWLFRSTEVSYSGYSVIRP